MKRYILWFSSSLWRVAALYATSILVCACLFAHIESRGLVESLYWACVTSLTIGYGDISPVTTAGRILTAVFAHFWVFGIAPLVITNMLSIVTEDRNAFTDEEQVEMMALLRSIKANTQKD
jgi:voltage-gated potassium channel